MTRKYFYFENAGHIKMDYEESWVRIDSGMIKFIDAIESGFEIVGIFFEKHKLGFFLREKQ